MKKLLYTLLFVPLALFGQEPISYQLSSGWNMVGFTGCEITPIDEAFQDALGNGSSLEETFEIIKDVRGIFWHQELGENSSLTHLTPGEGYMMYVNNGQATTVSFSEEYCNDITYQLNSGWNLIGYTLNFEQNCASVFQPIEESIVIVKDCYGFIYWPEIGFNGIGDLQPGESYMIYVNGDSTTVSFTENSTQEFENNPGVEFTLPVTDNNMSVIFPAGTLSDFAGDEIKANVVKYQYAGPDDAILGILPIDSLIVPTSETVMIGEDGSAGIPVIGGVANCNCADSGDLILFFITTDNGTLINLVLAPSVTYVANTLTILDNGSNNISFTIDGSDVVFGCTDEMAFNFDVYAVVDDGSCVSVEEYTIDSLQTANQVLSDEATNAVSSLQQALDTWNTTIDLSAGWNMFGYGCPNPIDVAEGFSNHTESITLVKDNNGSVYMPEFGFNGIGDFTPGFGYQIKLTVAIEGFSLCDWYVNDIPEDNIVSLQEENASLVDSLISMHTTNCIENGYCSFDSYNQVCISPDEGKNCDGDFVIGAEVLGGIVFYVDSTGQHGLVAAIEDLTEGATDPYGWGFSGYQWGCHEFNVNGSDGQSIGFGYQNTLDIVSNNCTTEEGGITAAQASLDYESEGYTDWYLPSEDEFIEMYNTIGIVNSPVNIDDFETSNFYWSSSENSSNSAICISFVDGSTNNHYKFAAYRVRPIRSF